MIRRRNSCHSILAYALCSKSFIYCKNIIISSFDDRSRTKSHQIAQSCTCHISNRNFTKRLARSYFYTHISSEFSINTLYYVIIDRRYYRITIITFRKRDSTSSIYFKFCFIEGINFCIITKGK